MAEKTMIEGLKCVGEAAELAGNRIAFKTSTLKVIGPINYKTDTMKVCCRQMRQSLCKALFVYDGKGIKLWGGDKYLFGCPFCGAAYD